MTATLQDAIQAIKSGDTDTAKTILNQLVELDPDHELAWLWMTKCVDHPIQQIYCLEEVLRINPDNEGAKRLLKKLKKKTGEVSGISQEPPQVVSPATKKFGTSLMLFLIPAMILILLFLGGWYLLSRQQQGGYSGNEVAGTVWGLEEEIEFRLGSIFIAEEGDEITVTYDAQIRSGDLAISIRPIIFFWEEPGFPRGEGTDSIYVGESGIGQFSFQFDEKSLYRINVDGLVGEEGIVDASYVIQWKKSTP